jgi:hypothetical protein
MDKTQARFLALWSRSGGIGAEAVYADLVGHYAKPIRRYHTLRHIRRCLRDLVWARAAIPDPDAVELALWCHEGRPGVGELHGTRLAGQHAGLEQHEPVAGVAGIRPSQPLFSPYQLNPYNMNPLRDVFETVDFELLKHSPSVKLFLCATNVLSGRIRVFTTSEISIQAVLASSCLPQLYQAVEIDGDYYWDGGYMGNPPIYPLIYETDTPNVLIIRINPIRIPQVPTTAYDILNRVNTLSFNSSLMREMRAIDFVTRLIDEGALDGTRNRRMLIHSIDAEPEMARLGVSSKFNAD